MSDLLSEITERRDIFAAFAQDHREVAGGAPTDKGTKKQEGRADGYMECAMSLHKLVAAVNDTDPLNLISRRRRLWKVGMAVNEGEIEPGEGDTILGDTEEVA